METEGHVKTLLAALEDGKGIDIKAYDVRGKSSLADFFVVVTGNAAPHLKALASAAKNAMHALSPAARTSGDPESGWIAVDFTDIVLHIFSPEARAYYALERLWDV